DGKGDDRPHKPAPRNGGNGGNGAVAVEAPVVEQTSAPHHIETLPGEHIALASGDSAPELNAASAQPGLSDSGAPHAIDETEPEDPPQPKDNSSPGLTPPPHLQQGQRHERRFGSGGGGGFGRDRGNDRGDRNERGGGRRGGGRFRRGGRRGDRRHGRDLPPSKYASPHGQRHEFGRDQRQGQQSGPRGPNRFSEPPAADTGETYEPILLPGESLAKYKEKPLSGVSSAVASAAVVEPGVHAEHGAPGGLVEPAAEATTLPESLYVQPESAVELHEDVEANVEFENGNDVQDEEAPEIEENGSALEAAGLSDEQAATLSESLAEAKHEIVADEADEDEEVHPVGGADFAEENKIHLTEAADLIAPAESTADAEDAEADEIARENDEEDEEEAADLAHDAAIAGIDEADEAHDTAIAALAAEERGDLTNEPSGENAMISDSHGQNVGQPSQPYIREDRSARVDDHRRPRFQRPMRRGGRQHGRPQRPHGRSRERHMAQRRPILISELLKAGQEIIVQIAKEPLGKKGARITSHVALPGRFLVYMPTVDHIGVSRKINSAEERSRLRRLVNEYKGSFPGGFIVRTAAGHVSDEDIRSDVEFLGKTWHEICTRSEQKKAPALLHRDLNLVERILRDHLSSEYSSIWIDGEEEYSKVLEFVSRFQPDLANRVKLYTKEAPIFEEFGIQQELDKSLRPKVWLKSGGYIVINHTEALVAIDVNTGKFVGRGSTRLEDTIVKTNLEAVKEIVRQIRLRDLGGIIIVDFIDMEERRNREKVMHALDEALRSDKAPSKVLGFNEFGLIAITRKRTKQSLEKVLCQPCPYCTGSGMVKSIPTVCYEIQAEAKKMAGDLDQQSITLRVNPEIAKALKTRESGLIEELETLTHKSVIIQSDPTLHWEQYDIF
ncbi:MAG TPA: Rne/Rng family ribonuclease, partial [Candidatus Acidoferrales bacterium]|nr:Rne/Rng family ribonuclease [Candidatus Acidoferrales bacterium]